MPIYEYECKKCKKSFEVLVFNSKEKIQCSFCKSKNVKRLLSKFSTGGVKSSTSNSSNGGSSCSGGSCSSCSGCH